MDAKQLIQLNNEKREQLTPENLKYYEDMLMYIRLNVQGDEQHTEEVLMEMLDHLLIAQAEGKEAKDVFGDDPKMYCDEILEEMPTENRRNQVLFGLYILLQFLSIIAIAKAIIGYAMFYLFGFGTGMMELYLGSTLVSVLLDIILLGVFLAAAFAVIRSSLFKGKAHNKIEFVKYFLLSLGLTAAFIVIAKYLPDFGEKISLPLYWSGFAGILLYGLACMLNRKYRIV